LFSRYTRRLYVGTYILAFTVDLKFSFQNMNAVDSKRKSSSHLS